MAYQLSVILIVISFAIAFVGVAFWVQGNSNTGGIGLLLIAILFAVVAVYARVQEIGEVLLENEQVSTSKDVD
jgi:uncharacterized membrane protein